jgi:hypothetical protein
MSRLLVPEKNRLISWDNTAQEINQSGSSGASPRSKLTSKLLGFVNRIGRLVVTTLINLPYTFFKLAYGTAKFVAQRLSNIRRFFFVTK